MRWVAAGENGAVYVFVLDVAEVYIRARGRSKTTIAGASPSIGPVPFSLQDKSNKKRVKLK